MEPKEVDFEFPRGDTPAVSFELTDANKNALEITPQNCEIIFTARDVSNNIVIQKHYSRGEIEVEGTTAKFFFKHDDTKDLKIGGKYQYDVQFSSGDFYKTMIIGTITLTKEQTY